MSLNSSDEFEFLLSLQSFTIHCVSNQSSSKIESYSSRLLSAVKNLSKFYIGHKIQLALALESASLRNQTKSKLNNQMNIISHLISLCRPDIDLNEQFICKQWTNIDLNQLIDSIEQRFQQQTSSTTIWLKLTNEQTLVSIDQSNYFDKISFEFVQHDTDIEQIFKWINQNQIHIHGKVNRTYTGLPLFWITPLQSSANQSKYGSIRLIFPFSLVYSNKKHHIFDLRTRRNGNHLWNNILISKRKQIAAYGFDFPEISADFLSPVDIAIDLTDGPLIVSNVQIVFVSHTQQCVPLSLTKLTSEHACYHTSQSAMNSFIKYLNTNTHLKLDQLKHLFDQDTFLKLSLINQLNTNS